MSQTALITGASGGIGLEFARVFARNGYDLVLVARSGDKLKQLADELKEVKVTVIVADLSDMQEIDRVVLELQHQSIHIDVLVNNAGFGEFGMFYETPWEKEAMMIDLNVKSLTYLTKIFLKPMIEKKYGRIINVASTAAFQPGPTMAVYFATKAYVLSFSEAISNELEGTGVRVTALCPGVTESGFQKAASMEESRLVKNRKLPSSAEVAQYGFDAMLRGKVVAVHGTMNKLMATSIRFTPRSIVRKVVRYMQDKAV